MKKRTIEIAARIGSKESEKIKEYLNTNGIKYNVSLWVFYEYYETSLDLDQWRKIKEHFNLKIDAIYCSASD